MFFYQTNAPTLLLNDFFSSIIICFFAGIKFTFSYTFSFSLTARDWQFTLRIIYFIFTTVLNSDDPMGEEEKRLKFLDQEKYDYILSYVEQLQPREETKDVDTHSVTTDIASDSGISGSKNTSSEVGTEDTSGKLKRWKPMLNNTIAHKPREIIL